MFHDFKQFVRAVRQTGLLMIGIPDYDTYVAHQRGFHRDAPIMTYQEFIRNRQEARYGGRGGRIGCC